MKYKKQDLTFAADFLKTKNNCYAKVLLFYSIFIERPKWI